MNLFVPDYVFDSIYEITPEFLLERGVLGALIDLDGTLAPNKSALPQKPEELAAFLRRLRSKGLSVLIFSNNRGKRVRRFCKELDTEFLYWAVKPTLIGFRKASKRLSLKPEKLAVIGDQIFTDVLVGNRVGALTCLVRTLDNRSAWVKLRCRLEKTFIEKGKRGSY